MKPYQHAKTSAREYGGAAEDYYAIHEFIDGSKAAVPDMRHRSVLHNSFGCYVVQSVFGITATNSDGKLYSPRDVAETHIIEDLGFLPSLEHWTRNMTLQPWMSGATRATHMRSGRTRAGAVDPAELEIRKQLRALGITTMGKSIVD